MKFNKNIIIILSVIALIVIVNATTKKEALPWALGGTTSLLSGASAVGVGAVAWYLSPWLLIPLGILYLGPGIISNWVELFNPSPSIPTWVWIVGAIILLFMVMRKK